ncbi:type II toxin-antitoxin system RelE/ParE family toxin [bacterium]|nr:type II toxin-antitoxin system RelE/ParE family toxin [bacterium]
MKYKVEFSQIVRRKMKDLKLYLTEQFGAATLEAAKSLADFPLKGASLAALFDIDTDFRTLYVKHNYLFYYIEGERIIISEMFDEREDFMFRLFGIRTASSDENGL